MPTEREVQGEIRQLRTELGIQTESEVQAEISTLQHELSLLPETFEEFTVRRQEEEERPISEDVSAFASGLGEGVGMLWDQAGNFASELINNGLPVFTAGKVVKDTAVVGAQDFGRFAKTITQAAFDKTYSEEEEIQREYKRYIQNHDYNTKVRPAMLGQVENRAITEFAANFVDPTLVLPVAGWGAKAGSVAAKGLQKAASAGAIATRSKGLIKTAEAAERVAGGLGAAAKDIDRVGYVMALPSKAAAITLRKGLKGAALGGALAAKGVALAGETTAKIAGTPRKLIAAAAAKVVPTDMKSLAGASAFGGQLVGAMTGAVPGAAQLGIAEAAGFVAGKLGRSAESVLTTLSQKGGNGRFLYRLATSEAAALPVRRAAMWAYTHAGTRLGDSAFNMAVNGASVGALNAALAWAADEPAEGMGAAAGAGALMGGVMPFGQPGLKGGKSQGARDATSIQNHIRNKVVADQRASFLKIPKDSQLMIATLNEANVGSPKVVVLPKDVYLDAFPDTSANYSIEERKIYVNEGRLKRGSQQAVELMAHEVGHDFVHQSLGNDPAMLRMLLEPYETTIDKGEAFYFQFDKGSGNPIGEPIYLDETASAIRTDYDRRFPTGEAWKGIGKNASTLAQEIGADQFSMMFSENPNAFDNFHPRLRRHLIDGSRKFLAATGQAEPLTGNPLTNTVSKQLHRNPAIARLYRNYGKARSFELIEKGNQAEAGVLIEPRKGQTGEDRFQELFGGVGISLKEGKNLRVTDKALFRELERIKERYRDDAPQGWKVTKQGWLTGKVLPDELRTIFTRNDRFGNVANILDALQESLSQRFGVRFGYRSGTKSKYQNPFKIRDAGLYAWMVSPIKFSGSASSQRPTRPTLKVVGFDEAKVRHNIQVLVEKGYVPDPVKFMADFAAQAQKALDDPEGRINPEGRKENERFTVAFGLKESADQIASPGLKELLESKTVKKTFVSYDVEALAGLAKGRDSAFAFDYENIRDNYSPFFSTRNFMPRQKPGPDDTIPLPFPELPGDKPGEGFGRMINVDKSKSEIAKAKALADEQDGFSSSGTVRAKNADGRDKLFMPADRALGLPDNIRDEVLPGIKQDKFSRGQLEAALLKSAGSKAYAEEIGLMDWLKDRKSVTKAEVDQFVRENAPRLEEKVLGRESVVRFGTGDPKFSDYQEPGGTNYREVLVKLPEKSANNSEIQALRQEAQSILEQKQALEAEGKYFDSNMLNPEVGVINARIRKLKSQDNFRDPHFNEDNVLLHLRLNDRIDANGKKVLFIEELQSDWHQKGRKDGYAGFNKKDYKIERNEAGNWDVIRLKDGEVVDVVKGEVSHGARKGEAIILGQAWEMFKDAVDAGILGGVPDAPFKKNWPALGLKRAIREALENGYDRIAWLDGEGQAARYDLSKQVDAIRITRDKDGTYEIMARSADDMAELGEFQTLATKVAKEKLADYIGKEPASKALDKMKDGVAELSGLDLKLGGEGMKAFYDRELVSIANKISKKIGGGKVRRERLGKPGLWGILDRNGKLIEEYIPRERAERLANLPETRAIPMEAKDAPSSHVLDLPKNPQAVENLRLYMPAQKAPSDSRVPTILRDAKGRGALVQPRAIESGFGTENIDAPKFVDKVLGDLKVDVQRTNFEKPEVNLADHYGKNALITMADRTPTDHVIYGINDVQFKTPLRLEGGRDYMFDSAHSPGAAWANEQNAMTAMLNRREKLGGEDMLVIPMEMAPTSVDFPTMAPALHIRYAQVAMKAKDKRYVSSLVKKGGEGFLNKSQDQVKVPKFDIDMENVEAFLSKLSGPQRKTINNVFDMVNRPSSAQKGKGVRQIDGALSNFEMRAAISDPAMFNQKSLMQTTNVGLMTGGQAPSMHSTYNAAMKGEGLGVLKVPEGFQPKAQDFLPDLFKKSNKDYVDSSEAFTARKGVRTAKIDEALLKRLGL